MLRHREYVIYMAIRSHIIASSALIALLVSACSSGDPLSDSSAESTDEGQLEERYGALSVEYNYPRHGADEGLLIQAQFLDIRGVAIDSALEALEVWKPRRHLEMGECLIDDGQGQRGSTKEVGSLHLLDVGDIGITSPRDRVVLEPRRLPDLLSSFYGVVYSSEWGLQGEDRTVEYYPGASYGFMANGTSQAGSFSFDLVAPEPMVLLAADGLELRDRQMITVGSEDPLELVWNSDGADSRAEVFIDMTTGFGPDQARVQCRADDQGAFAVPADIMAHLNDLDDSLDLELRRVHRDQIMVEGLDEVEVYFSATDRVELYFE
jgi:hypothetical protein